METADCIRRILCDYPHINEVESWGEMAFFITPMVSRVAHICAPSNTAITVVMLLISRAFCRNTARLRAEPINLMVV